MEELADDGTVRIPVKSFNEFMEKSVRHMEQLRSDIADNTDVLRQVQRQLQQMTVSTPAQQPVQGVRSGSSSRSAQTPSFAAVAAVTPASSAQPLPNITAHIAVEENAAVRFPLSLVHTNNIAVADFVYMWYNEELYRCTTAPNSPERKSFHFLCRLLYYCKCVVSVAYIMQPKPQPSDGTAKMTEWTDELRDFADRVHDDVYEFCDDATEAAVVNDATHAEATTAGISAPAAKKRKRAHTCLIDAIYRRMVAMPRSKFPECRVVDMTPCIEYPVTSLSFHKNV